MAELSFSPDCFTYGVVACANCGTLTLPDDQQIILRGKQYIPICLPCYFVIGEKYAQQILS